MDHTIFMDVQEVMKIVGFSERGAYRLISKLNEEMEEMGYITVRGRVNRIFLAEKMYLEQSEKVLKRERLSDSIFMRAVEVETFLGVSRGEAYRIIKKLNDELKEKGYLVIAGRINRHYLEQRTYGVQVISKGTE